MKKSDRCDACRAQAHAHVRKTTPGGTVLALWFCMHHFNASWEALMATNWRVVEKTPVEDLASSHA
jgi:hypothetical protein